MQATCEKCEASFNIPEQKIPKGKVFTAACPKCREKTIRIDSTGDAPFQVKTDSGARAAPAAPPPDEEPDRPMGKKARAAAANGAGPDPALLLRQEGARTAIICEQDLSARARIKSSLEALDYHVSVSQSAREALKQMRFHVFDLIVLNESFDTPDPKNNQVLKFVGRMVMSTRRNVFVALLSDHDRTGDNMIAFNKSVNIVINTSEVDDIELLLRNAVADTEHFYRVYKGIKEKLGAV
ncbi:MAG: zinc-ribbon domain-containing protein [Desulfatibacillaceae bacterium]